jgi:hypothetical protein
VTNSSYIKLNFFNKKQKEEKDSFNQLNENFSKYLQAIRFFEIENKKLIILIQIIENSIKNKSSSVENIYQIEISQANQILHQLQNQNHINLEQRLDREIFCDEINKFHETNQNEILLKTILQTQKISLED